MDDGLSADPNARAHSVPFVGGSEMATRMAAFDWAQTPVGPVEQWPESLRTAVGICLSSRYPMVIWWGPDLVLLYNDAWIPIVGPEKHPALGRPGKQVWPENWHIVGRQMHGVLETGVATYSDDQLLPVKRFGYLEEAYFTYSYSAIREESGHVGGVFIAVTETTQRVLSERRLRTSRALGEATTRAATGEGATVHYVFGAAMEALSLDRADTPFAAVFQRDPEHPEPRLVASMGLLGSPSSPPMQDGGPNWWEDVDGNVPETPEALAADWAAAVETGAGPVGEMPPEWVAVVALQAGGDDSQGAFLVVGLTPYRPFDDDLRGYLDLVVAQISRSARDAEANQAQRRRAEALAQLDTAKTEFFANVSHEFRTPLTLIAGPVDDSLADFTEPLGPAQRRRLEVIRRNAARLTRLVDDMLDFARIEAGRRQPEHEVVDLTATTRELIASFEPVAAKAGLQLRSTVTDLPHPVAVDVGMWEKIVLNLLSNAVKYTSAGHVDVRLTLGEGQVVLEVADTGIGIPADEQPHVFERFHRVRAQAGRSHEGAGIGLALVAELVRLHDGSCAVESVEGQGSTFTVRLPLTALKTREGTGDIRSGPGRVNYSAYADEALQWADAAAATAEPAGQVGEPADDACVLVVEDNTDMRTFIAGVLRPNWRVVEAADGRAGLAAALSDRPALVLTDVMMPHLDGFGLLEALRADPRTSSVPVIFLSAKAGEEAAVGGLLAGADDYLPKPFSTVELVARVRSNLEMARLRNRESDFRRALMDSLQEGFFVLDDTGAMIEANQAFFTLIGYDAAGLPYRWPQPWIAEGDRGERWSSMRSAAREAALSDGVGQRTMQLRHRDGHPLWAAFSAAAVADPHTGRRLYVGTARDVTAERLAAQRDATLARFAAALAPARTPAGLLAAASDELANLFPGARVFIRGAPAGNAAPAPILAALDAARRSPAGLVPATGDGTALMSAPLGGSTAIGIEAPTEWRPEQRELFGLLMSHLSQALVGARELEQTRAVALTLQDAILGPTELPHGFAVRYTPAVEPFEIGGDWYDVVALENERIGIVVGDCVGRGLPAAAVMGQLRSAAQALLIRTADPEQTLDGLDRFARRVPAAIGTTVFCAVIDQTASTIRYSSAGHPPPIVAAVNTRRLLGGAQGLPLAVAEPRERPVAIEPLSDGSTVLLYTDGLIERRHEALTEGIDRATAVLADCIEEHPEKVADRLMTSLAPMAGYDDDVAVLVYRHRPAVLNVSVSAIPTSLATVRARMRRWLPAAGIDGETAAEVLLAVGEAASNAAEHAVVGARHKVELTVRAAVTGEGLRLTVSDNGCWKPPPQFPGNRGHGIRLMDALLDAVNVTRTEYGTTVEMLKELC